MHYRDHRKNISSRALFVPACSSRRARQPRIRIRRSDVLAVASWDCSLYQTLVTRRVRRLNHELKRRVLGRGHHRPPLQIATPPSHIRMLGTRNTFVQNMPAAESSKAATESAMPNTPTAIPMLETHAGYA